MSSYLYIHFSLITCSLLTGDAWAVIFSIGEGIKPPPSFYVALIITISGVVLYETAPPPDVADSQDEGVGDVQLTVNNGRGREETEQDGHELT